MSTKKTSPEVGDRVTAVAGKTVSGSSSQLPTLPTQHGVQVSKPSMRLEFDGDDEIRQFVERLKAAGELCVPFGIDGQHYFHARVVEASAVLEVSRSEMIDSDGRVTDGSETLRKVAGMLVLEFDTAEDCEEVFDQIANDRGTLEVIGGYLPQIRRMEKF